MIDSEKTLNTMQKVGHQDMGDGSKCQRCVTAAPAYHLVPFTVFQLSTAASQG